MTSLHCKLGAIAHLRSASQCCAAKARAPLCTASILPAAVCSILPDTFCICQDRSGPRFFFIVTRSHILRRNCSTPKAAHNFPREAVCSIIALHFEPPECYWRLTRRQVDGHGKNKGSGKSSKDDKVEGCNCRGVHFLRSHIQHKSGGKSKGKNTNKIMQSVEKR